MNLIDKAIEAFNPISALKRAEARKVLSYYEATRPDRLRKRNKETGGPSSSLETAGRPMREQARFLDQNHDLASGVLDILVANAVGPNGIAVEPQPRTNDNKIHTEFASQIMRAHKDWAQKPEVTWQHDWASAQRILARSWFRDGEVFSQHVAGVIPKLTHGTAVPYSIEMLEADFVPIGYSAQNITQGVERNAWNRPVAFFVYKQHPNELNGFNTLRITDYKRVPAERMMHCKLVKRINQVRGMSVFATVMLRLDDLKDYEESERIAAKVAASMAAYITKGSPDVYNMTDSGDTEQRNMKFQPGMIFDDLMPGESVGTIDTNRPNPQLEPHRKGQLRAVASGTGVTYSSASKDYNGSYSSQRQELVEANGAYQILASEFIGQIVRPTYEQFLNVAILSGELKVPAGINPQTLTDALYAPPQMPWIDPVKEAKGWALLEENNYASGPEIIRRRGLVPADVLAQQESWQEQKSNHNLADNLNADSVENNDSQQSTGFESMKQEADAYGVAVRAGAITPQSEDEENFRTKAGMPEMSGEVVDAWQNDGNVRRPITLQSGDAFEASQDAITGDESND